MTGYTLQFFAASEKELDAFVAKLEAMYGQGKKADSTITFPMAPERSSGGA